MKLLFRLGALVAFFLPEPHGLAQSPKSSLSDVRHGVTETFQRADRDGNGWLDIDEFSSLILVSTELTYLRRGVVAEEVQERTMMSPRKGTILKLARLEYVESAGTDFLMAEYEFQELALRLFLKDEDSASKYRYTDTQRLLWQAFTLNWE